MAMFPFLHFAVSAQICKYSEVDSTLTILYYTHKGQDHSTDNWRKIIIIYSVYYHLRRRSGGKSATYFQARSKQYLYKRRGD